MDALWADDVAAVTALLASDTDVDADATSTSVDELLSFLDAPPVTKCHDVVDTSIYPAILDDATSIDSRSERSNSPAPSSSSTKRTRARAGGSSQMKRSLETLRSEATALADKLQQLQTQSRRTRSAVMETALAERFKRRRAESERQQLRDAVLTQQRFVRGLTSVFSSPPSFVSGLNMCHYLHNYTRLPRDRATRWREYAALAQETRLRNAMDILCRETESLTLADDDDNDPSRPSACEPFIQVEMVPDAGGFSVTTTSVYAVETGDVGAVLRGACLAACDLMSTCPAYPTIGITQAIVDPDAPTSWSTTDDNDQHARTLYRAMDVSYKSIDDHDTLVVASRGVTISKETDDGAAVVVWDFVDDDEQYPTSETDADITRQAVGACLIRREICGDGRERTVYRALSTRRYRYHVHAPRDTLQRYFLDSRRRMRTNELLFRDILMDAVAQDDAATNAAQCRRGLCV